MDEKTFSLFQVCDSAFPSGTFVHSFGLESAVAAGKILKVHEEPGNSTKRRRTSRGKAVDVEEGKMTTEEYFDLFLSQFANLQLPMLRNLLKKLRIFSNGETNSVEQIVGMLQSENCHISAQLANAVAIAASKKQGMGFAKAFSEIFPNTRPILSSLIARGMRDDRYAPHQILVLGIFGHIQKYDIFELQFCALFCALRDLANASLRLNLLGPFQAAKVLHQFRDSIIKLAREHGSFYSPIRINDEIKRGSALEATK
ncbi:MAG: urease accessory UreF family protein, partial [Bacteroidota bacterium]